MKLNISNPATGQQKVFTIEDEQKVMYLYEKRMGMEIEGGPLGEQFEGAVFRISGGNDKQGFPMMQGVLKNQRVRLLFSDGMKCYRIRRKGMRKRKSVRGCYVGYDIAILNLVLVKSDKDIEGLTDGQGTHRLGPKRAGKIRKMFNLDNKKDSVKPYVIRREITNEEGTVKNKKAPKIQRLITKVRLQRRRFRKNSMIKKVQQSRKDQKAYHQRVHDYKIQQKEARHAAIAKKKKSKKVIKA